MTRPPFPGLTPNAPLRSPPCPSLRLPSPTGPARTVAKRSSPRRPGWLPTAWLHAGRTRPLPGLAGRMLAALVLAGLLLIPVPPALAQAGGDEGNLIDRVVAIVNQEAVTYSELGTRLALISRQLSERGQPLPPQDQFEKQVLEQLIMDRIRNQAAGEMGVKPSESEIDRAVADIAQREGVSLQTMREQIQDHGLSFSGYREQIAGEITNLRLRDREAREKVTVTEAEVDAYLARRGVIGTTEYEVGHILLQLEPDADDATVRARTAAAEQIVQRARSVADFAALTREVSEAPDAATGGNLGWRPADRLPQIFMEAVTPLSPGQIAGPIRSPAGLHVVKLIGRRQGGASAGAAEFGQTHVRHILLRAQNQAEVDEATRRLTEFRRRIEAGESFESLARQFSIDGSAGQGGDLGWIYPGETVPEFERAMNALGPDQFSDPVQTAFGVHLIQVLERRAGDNSPDRVRALARQAVREQKAGEAFEQWLREQRDRAYVEYRLDQG